MKHYSLLLSVLSVISLASCNVDKPSTSDYSELSSESITNQLSSDDYSSNNQTSSSENNIVDENGNYLVSSIKTLSGNKTYLQVDGKPFAIRGGQIRIDGLLNRDYNNYPDAMDPLSYDEIEKYFKTAKNFNLNTLQLPLDWRRIEVSKDVYDFTLVDKLLTMSNKYDLKCEFLWFSTNMCGDSHEFQLPDYIIYDTQTYPRFQFNKDILHSALYGDMFYLILNDKDLMERESKVLEKIMDHVYTWNIENGSKNPLIGIQVHNESDGLLRWRLDQRKIKLNGTDVTPEYLWNTTLEALDNAGKTIKKSKYKIYTRCNMTVTLGVGKFPQFPDKDFSPLDVLRLEGIDMIGDDPYSSLPTAINKTIKSYATEGNYPHISENMGNYASSPALFLTTYQAGGSYMFYDFATPEYFVWINGGNSYQMDQGILNPDLSYKKHTAETLSIVNGIAKMDSIIPLVNSEDFAAFNVLKEQYDTNLTQTINTSNLKFTYKTTNGGIAFAIEHGEYAYIYATKDCTFSIDNASVTLKADIGYFKNNEFIIEDNQFLASNIEIKQGNLYRIKIRSINEKVSSTTNKNV